MQPNTELVAYCGLYCGACGAYMKGKCPGCHENEKASWCKIRVCCMELNYASCADCEEFPDPMVCEKFNNFMSRLFGFIFRSNRSACIQSIKDLGLPEYAHVMATEGKRTIRR